jgi:pyrimidine operon attenuation protein/uracil phosphoribosyltransferase
MKRPDQAEESGKEVLDAAGMAQKIAELGQSILKEFGADGGNVALVGIQTRGAHLARRLAAWLTQKIGHDVPVGILDITLYRDDVLTIAEQPTVKETDLPFDLEARPLVLVDDVLFTGRTIRSAMNAIVDYGRPQCVRLAILIDRGHRELPISADYIGLTLATRRDDSVDVNMTEIDGSDSVCVRPDPKDAV